MVAGTLHIDEQFKEHQAGIRMTGPFIQPSDMVFPHFLLSRLYLTAFCPGLFRQFSFIILKALQADLQRRFCKLPYLGNLLMRFRRKFNFFLKNFRLRLTSV